MTAPQTHREYVAAIMDRYPGQVVIGCEQQLDGSFEIHEWDGEAHAVSACFETMAEVEPFKRQRRRHFEKELGRRVQSYYWHQAVTAPSAFEDLGKAVVVALSQAELAAVLKVRWAQLSDADAGRVAQLMWEQLVKEVQER